MLRRDPETGERRRLEPRVPRGLGGGKGETERGMLTGPEEGTGPEGAGPERRQRSQKGDGALRSGEAGAL